MRERNGGRAGKVGGFEGDGLEVVEGEEVGGYNGEVGTERDGGEVYRSEVGLVAGDAGEGTGGLVGEPVGEQRWVGKRSFEAEELLRRVSGCGK